MTPERSAVANSPVNSTACRRLGLLQSAREFPLRMNTDRPLGGCFVPVLYPDFDSFDVMFTYPAFAMSL